MQEKTSKKISSLLRLLTVFFDLIVLIVLITLAMTFTQTMALLVEFLNCSYGIESV